MKNMTLTKLDGFSAYQGYRYTHRFLEGFSRGMGKGTGIFTMENLYPWVNLFNIVQCLVPIIDKSGVERKEEEG